MPCSRIYEGLRAMEAHGACAREAARLGLLERAFALDDVADAPEAARAALDRIPDADKPSPAARAFLGYLDQAVNLRFGRPHRRGGRRRVLN